MEAAVSAGKREMNDFGAAIPWDRGRDARGPRGWRPAVGGPGYSDPSGSSEAARTPQSTAGANDVVERVRGCRPSCDADLGVGDRRSDCVGTAGRALVG